jgi:hypothetical protein
LTFIEASPNCPGASASWRASKLKEDPFSAVVLTNYSWHWHGEEAVDAGGQHWFVVPFYPVVALPGPDADRIWESVRAYGTLPEG